MNPVFAERRYLIPFRATLLSQIFTDVLVIGGGVAGMRAALAAAEHSDVIVANKGQIEQSNTYWAQGGIACVLDESDTVEKHVKDTLVAGAGLCDESVVRTNVAGGPDRIRELIHNRAAEADIRSAALEAGMTLMRDDGERLVRERITTAEEVLRVTRD